MGYTHYWTRPFDNTGTDDMFAELRNDTARIIRSAEANGIAIRGANGFGQPEFSEEYFAFNGDAMNGDPALGRYDHESFFWDRSYARPEWNPNEDSHFNFCKTAYKPYDAVVTAVLLRAKEIYGDLVEVSSDGTWEEWSTGRILFTLTFGRVANCPFSKHDVTSL